MKLFPPPDSEGIHVDGDAVPGTCYKWVLQNVVGADVGSHGSITYCFVKRKQIKTMVIQKCCVILSSAPKHSSLGESS